MNIELFSERPLFVGNETNERIRNPSYRMIKLLVKFLKRTIRDLFRLVPVAKFRTLLSFGKVRSHEDDIILLDDLMEQLEEIRPSRRDVKFVLAQLSVMWVC